MRLEPTHLLVPSRNICLWRSFCSDTLVQPETGWASGRRYRPDIDMLLKEARSHNRFIKASYRSVDSKFPFWGHQGAGGAANPDCSPRRTQRGHGPQPKERVRSSQHRPRLSSFDRCPCARTTTGTNTKIFVRCEEIERVVQTITEVCVIKRLGIHMIHYLFSVPSVVF